MLDRVNAELLRTFVVVGAAPTFAAAARQRHVSVSAISQQIKALEGQLGMPLFERSGRRARLTADGRRLLVALAEELQRIDDALEEAAAAHAEVRGRVRLGSPRTFGGYWLRPRLPALLRAHPGLAVEVVFDVPSALERQVIEGTLDAAILVRAPGPAGLAAVPIHTETFVAVAAPSVIRGRTLRSAADFAALPWIVFDRDLPMHEVWWRAAFGRPSPPVRVVCEIASLDEMRALAESGVGAAVLPDYHLVPRRVRILAPPGARPARNVIRLVWRKSAAPTARVMALRAALGVPLSSR